MEKWQKDHIEANLVDLCEKTDCSTAVLVRLEAKKILSRSDVSALKTKNGFARSQELYDKLITRKNAYPTLIEVLRDECQSSAVEILQRGSSGSPLTNSVPRNGPSKPGETTEIGRPTQNDSKNLGNNQAEDQIDFVSNINPLKVLVKKPSSPMSFTDDQYQLSVNFKGYALILNIIEFVNTSRNRGGAKLDTQYMTDLWSQLGYQVTKYEGFFTFIEVDEILDKFKSQFDSHSGDEPISCVLFIGSHGCFSKIESSDHQEINLYKHIIYKFDTKNCPQLEGRPKIFLIQACQRFQTDDAGPPNDRLEVDGYLQTPIDDTIACFSTIPGFVANRDLYLGTWYTYCLAKVIMEEAHRMDLLRMLKKTQETMRKINAHAPQGQLSTYLDLGIKTVYFNMSP